MDADMENKVYKLSNGNVENESPLVINKGVANFGINDTILAGDFQADNLEIPSDIDEMECRYYEEKYGENAEYLPPLPLLDGIDTLYIGFYVGVNKRVLEWLERAKEKAQKEREAVSLKVSGYEWLVQPCGKEHYAYICDNSEWTVYVSRVMDMPYPTVYVRLKSLLLWQGGAVQAVKETRDMVRKCFGEISKEKVSRVDMCADFMGTNLKLSDCAKFVTRATDRCIHNTSGDDITGMDFGKGRIRARVYNKTREITRSKKDWFYDLWGIEKDSADVWRVEFQLRRELLKEYHVENFETFVKVAADIWNYLTNEWLSMREMDNANATRRSLSGLWLAVQETTMDFFGRLTGTVRDTARKATITLLTSMIRGCAISISALLLNAEREKLGDNAGIDLASVLQGILNEITREYDGAIDSRVPIDYGAEIEKRAIKYA